MYCDDGIVEFWENQRFWGLSWGVPLLPFDWPAWSDPQGNAVQLSRPPEREGERGWFVVRTLGTDEEGWRYSTVFSKLDTPRPGGRASKRSSDYVRSRVWRKLTMDPSGMPDRELQTVAAAPWGTGAGTGAAATGGGSRARSHQLEGLDPDSMYDTDTVPEEQMQTDVAVAGYAAAVRSLPAVATSGAAGSAAAAVAIAGAAQRAATPRLHPEAERIILSAVAAAGIASGGGRAGGGTAPGALPKPSLFKLWQLFMELWNDACARHGMRRLVPLDPLGLYVAARRHRELLARQRVAQLAVGRLVAAAPLATEVEPDVLDGQQDPETAQQSAVAAGRLSEAAAAGAGTSAAAAAAVAAAAASAAATAAAHQSPAVGETPTGAAIRQPAVPQPATVQRLGAGGTVWDPDDLRTASITEVPGRAHAAAASGRSGAPAGVPSDDAGQSPRLDSQEQPPGQPQPHKEAQQQQLAADQGLMPDLDDPATLLSELVTATNYARAAYGYVMAAGHLDSLTKLFTMLGSSAHFNPITGASAEANLEAIHLFTGIPVEDVVMAEWRSSVFRPCHYLAVDRRRRRLVLAVRGSLELADIATDLTARPVEFDFGGGLVGHVHQGLMSAASYVQLNTAAALRSAAERFPGWPLLVTGHSLGAGVAALLTLLLQRRPIRDPSVAAATSGITPDPEPDRPLAAPVAVPAVHCLAIAPPAVLSVNLAEAARGCVVSVINHGDFVARLSCYSVDRALLELVQASPAAQMADTFLQSTGATLAAIQQRLAALGGGNGGGGGGAFDGFAFLRDSMAGRISGSAGEQSTPNLRGMEVEMVAPSGGRASGGGGGGFGSGWQWRGAEPRPVGLAHHLSAHPQLPVVGSPGCSGLKDIAQLATDRHARYGHTHHHHHQQHHNHNSHHSHHHGPGSNGRQSPASAGPSSAGQRPGSEEAFHGDATQRHRHHHNHHDQRTSHHHNQQQQQPEQPEQQQRQPHHENGHSRCPSNLQHRQPPSVLPPAAAGTAATAAAAAVGTCDASAALKADRVGGGEGDGEEYGLLEASVAAPSTLRPVRVSGGGGSGGGAAAGGAVATGAKPPQIDMEDDDDGFSIVSARSSGGGGLSGSGMSYHSAASPHESYMSAASSPASRVSVSFDDALDAGFLYRAAHPNEYHGGSGSVGGATPLPHSRVPPYSAVTSHPLSADSAGHPTGRPRRASGSGSGLSACTTGSRGTHHHQQRDARRPGTPAGLAAAAAAAAVGGVPYVHGHHPSSRPPTQTPPAGAASGPTAALAISGSGITESQGPLLQPGAPGAGRYAAMTPPTTPPRQVPCGPGPGAGPTVGAEGLFAAAAETLGFGLFGGGVGGGGTPPAIGAMVSAPRAPSLGTRRSSDPLCGRGLLYRAGVEEEDGGEDEDEGSDASGRRGDGPGSHSSGARRSRRGSGGGDGRAVGYAGWRFGGRIGGGMPVGLDGERQGRSRSRLRGQVAAGGGAGGGGDSLISWEALSRNLMTSWFGKGYFEDDEAVEGEDDEAARRERAEEGGGSGGGGGGGGGFGAWWLSAVAGMAGGGSPAAEAAAAVVAEPMAAGAAGGSSGLTSCWPGLEAPPGPHSHQDAAPRGKYGAPERLLTWPWPDAAPQPQPPRPPPRSAASASAAGSAGAGRAQTGAGPPGPPSAAARPDAGIATPVTGAPAGGRIADGTTGSERIGNAPGGRSGAGGGAEARAGAGSAAALPPPSRVRHRHSLSAPLSDFLQDALAASTGDLTAAAAAAAGAPAATAEGVGGRLAARVGPASHAFGSDAGSSRHGRPTGPPQPSGRRASAFASAAAEAAAGDMGASAAPAEAEAEPAEGARTPHYLHSAHKELYPPGRLLWIVAEDEQSLPQPIRQLVASGGGFRVAAGGAATSQPTAGPAATAAGPDPDQSTAPAPSRLGDSDTSAAAVPGQEGPGGAPAGADAATSSRPGTEPAPQPDAPREGSQPGAVGTEPQQRQAASSPPSEVPAGAQPYSLLDVSFVSDLMQGLVSGPTMATAVHPAGEDPKDARSSGSGTAGGARPGVPVGTAGGARPGVPVGTAGGARPGVPVGTAPGVLHTQLASAPEPPAAAAEVGAGGDVSAAGKAPGGTPGCGSGPSSGSKRHRVSFGGDGSPSGAQDATATAGYAAPCTTGGASGGSGGGGGGSPPLATRQRSGLAGCFDGPRTGPGTDTGIVDGDVAAGAEAAAGLPAGGDGGSGSSTPFTARVREGLKRIKSGVETMLRQAPLPSVPSVSFLQGAGGSTSGSGTDDGSGSDPMVGGGGAAAASGGTASAAGAGAGNAGGQGGPGGPGQWLFLVEVEDRTVFERMILVPASVTEHLPDAYFQKLRQLAKGSAGAAAAAAPASGSQPPPV